nr:hypothetical protein [uncultured Pedobacter sp.]
MTFVIERKGGKLTGTVQDSTGNEMTQITQITEKEKSITAAFTVQGYDITLSLDPVDEIIYPFSFYTLRDSFQ